MSPDQPDVLAYPHIATAVAEATMGQTPSPEEVAIVKEEASNRFVELVGTGSTRVEAARLINDEMAKLMSERFTAEEMSLLKSEAGKLAAMRLQERIQRDHELYNAVLRAQQDGGPEVKSGGVVVNNPERRSPDANQIAQMQAGTQSFSQAA